MAVWPILNLIRKFKMEIPADGMLLLLCLGLLPVDIPRSAREIHALAQTEPVIAGIDTRLRLAEVLKSRHPVLARQLLDECVQAFGSGIDSDTLSDAGPNTVQLFLDLAPDEAEHAARALPGRRVPEGVNAREFGYDVLAGYWKDRDPAKAERLLYSAFGAGAFRLYSGQSILRSLAKENPARAHELFAQFLIAFPVLTADTRDMMFLLECSRLILATDPALAGQAVEKVLASVNREGFEDDSPATLT
jgi:hypothetical protein